MNNFSANILKNVVSVIGANQNADSRYISICNNIAFNFQLMGDFDRASEIREEILSLEECHNAGNYLALVNKAYSEILEGNYQKAIRLLDGVNDADYGFMYKDYVYQELILSLTISNDRQAIDILRHYIDFSKQNLSSVLLTYSESERESYWSQRSLMLEMLTNAVSWKYQTPDLLKDSYNITLFTKSLLLKFSRLLFDYAKYNSSNETYMSDFVRQRE